MEAMSFSLLTSSDLNNLVKTISELLITTSANWIISGGILLVAIAVYFFGFRPICRRLNRQMYEANNELSKFPDEKTFAQSYEAFDAWAKEYPIIGESWQEFSETLLFPKPDAHQQVIRNSVDPELYFNDGSIIEPHMNLRFYSAFPNYLTGAGILGTFIGLVAGIFLATGGLTNTDVEEVKKSLQSLLSGASLAFMTSIAGLIGSILFSVAEKHALHKLQNSIANWNTYLNRYLLRVTPEQLASEQIAEAVKQSLHLERFNTDFAVTMAESLNDRLSASFRPTLERLVENLESANRGRGDIQQKALEDVVKQFKEALTGSAGTEMASMKTVFEELNRGLKETVGKVVDGQNNLLVLTEAMTTGIGKAVEENIRNFQQTVSDSIGRIITRLEEAGGTTASKITNSGSTAAESLNYASSRLTDSVTGLDGIVKRTEEMMHQHQESIYDLQKVLTALKSTANSVSASALPLNDSVKQLYDTGKSLTVGMDRLSSFSEVLRKSANDIAVAQEKTTLTWLQYEKRFAGIDLSLKKAFEQITEAQAAHSEQMRAFVTDVDKEFAESLESLSAVVKELFDAAEVLNDTLGRMTGGPKV